MTKRRKESRFIGRPSDYRVVTPEEAAELLKRRKAEVEAWIAEKKKRRAEELEQQGETSTQQDNDTNKD